MKRAPSPRPDWIEICRIDHGSKGVIPFPMIQDLASLMWVINLGCIDLNEWYARCDDTIGLIICISISIRCRTRRLKKCVKRRCS